MKKINLAVLILVFAFAMVTSVYASPLKAATTFGTAVIDGVNTEGEWDSVTPYPVDKFKQSTGTAGSVKGTYKVKWDGSSLYALVEVEDSSVSKSGETDKQDNIQVYIEYDNSGSGQYNDPYEKEYQFLINRSGNYDQYDCIPFDLNNNIDVSVKSSEQGYSIEFKLNLAAIAGETVPENKEIGFDIQINDFKGSQRLAAYAWNDQYDNSWMDVSALGKLTLAAESNVTNPDETPEPEETPDSSQTQSEDTEPTASMETNGHTVKPISESKDARWLIIVALAILIICGAAAFIIIKKSKKA